MRRIPVVISACCVMAMAGAILAAGPNVQYDLTGWKTLEMTSGKIVASGGTPLITTTDGKIRLSASKVSLSLSGGKGKGVKAITTAQATGGVKLFLKQGPGQTVEAVSQKAVIVPAQNRADLTGSVRVTQTDPKFARPLVLTGDSVTVYMKEGRIIARSAPGKSRLSATPKSGEKP
jgi:lipopolysaccharide export system protein LptA